MDASSSISSLKHTVDLGSGVSQVLNDDDYLSAEEDISPLMRTALRGGKPLQIKAEFNTGKNVNKIA
jgi:hypothetical protein